MVWACFHWRSASSSSGVGLWTWHLQTHRSTKSLAVAVQCLKSGLPFPHNLGAFNVDLTKYVMTKCATSCYIMLHLVIVNQKQLDTIRHQFHHLPILRPLNESRVNCSPSPTHSPMKSQGVSAVLRDPHLHRPPEVRQKPSSARSNWLEAVQSEASSQTSLKSQGAWNVGFPEVFPSESRSFWLIS